MRVKIDDVLKAKCPKTTPGCVTALVVAQPSPEALVAELNGCEQSILRLPEPRAVSLLLVSVPYSFRRPFPEL